MAGNRKVYDTAMAAAKKFVSAQHWPNALKAYRAAIQEFPNDMAAVVGIGDVYCVLNQHESAIRAFQRALKVNQAHPIPWLKMGDALMVLGHSNEAMKTYIQAGNLYAKAGQLEPAVQNWRKVVDMDSQQLQARNNLAQAYVRLGQKDLALDQLLNLAVIYQEQGQEAKVNQSLQGAIRLDPDNTRVKTALRAFENGVSIQMALAQMKESQAFEVAAGIVKAEVAPQAFSDEEENFFSLFADEDGDTTQTAGSGNIRQRTYNNALEELTNVLFEDETQYQGISLSKSQIDSLITQCLEQQTRSLNAEALANCEQLIQAGIRRPDLYFVAGDLSLEVGDYQKAIPYFEQAKSAQSYLFGANFALGKCMQGQGNTKQALHYFIETLKLLDLKHSDSSRSAKLNQLYESLLQNYVNSDDPQKGDNFVEALMNFLSSEDPEQILIEARQNLSHGDEISVNDLAEFIAAPNPDAVMTAMRLTKDHLQKNLLETAMEECYQAIYQSPFYLPLHLRLAEIFARRDRIEASVQKYLMVAEVYHIRGDLTQEAETYKKVLKVAPMDVDVRRNLVNLYLNRSDFEGAVEQYIFLSDAYYQLAQVDTALAKYKEALQLASRSANPKTWQVKILHNVGDIYNQRVDWRKAAAAYEQILKLNDEDDKASLALIELYFKLGATQNALSMLDRIIARQLKAGQQDKLLEFLQDQIDLRPEELRLQDKLAGLYARLGRNEEAINLYDQLGEFQLEAGLRDDAARTIQRILSLGPANPRGYQQLLDQIKAGI